MEIIKKTEGNNIVLEIHGWLETQSASELADALAELPQQMEGLIFDLADLEYISSTGIREIIAAHKMTKGNLRLRNVPDEIMDVLQMTGIDKKLQIEG